MEELLAGEVRRAYTDEQFVMVTMGYTALLAGEVRRAYTEALLQKRRSNYLSTNGSPSLWKLVAHCRCKPSAALASASGSDYAHSRNNQDICTALSMYN
jgi:hypothetical protein